MATKPVETNFNAATAYVEATLKKKQDGILESASGIGSSLKSASVSLAFIDAIASEYGVESILDLGCGDWNWMKSAKWRGNPHIVYEGWDAHQGLVEQLNLVYGDERTRFLVRDINVPPFPKADLIICRDVLFHLPISAGVALAHQMRDARTLVVSTSFLSIQHNEDIVPNPRIPGWGHYLINLDIEPFCFRDFKRRAIAEKLSEHEGPERSICLYDFREA